MHRTQLILTIFLAPTLVMASREFPVPDAPIPEIHRIWIAGMMAGLPASQTVATDPIAGVREEFDALLAKTRDQGTIVRWAKTKLVKQREELELLKTLQNFGKPSGIEFGLLSRDTSYADALSHYMLTGICTGDSWIDKDGAVVYRLRDLFLPYVQQRDLKMLLILSVAGGLHAKKIGRTDLDGVSFDVIEEWMAKAREDAAKSELEEVWKEVEEIFAEKEAKAND